MYIYIHILIHIFVYKPVEEGENVTGRGRVGATLETRTELPTAHEHVDVVGSHERLGHVDDCHCERPAHNDYDNQYVYVNGYMCVRVYVYVCGYFLVNVFPVWLCWCERVYVVARVCMYVDR